MNSDYYNKDTVDAKLDSMHEMMKTIDIKVDDLNKKVSYTNGKVKKHQQILLVVGTATFVILVMGGSKFVDLLKMIFF